MAYGMMISRVKPETLIEKPATVTLCPPQSLKIFLYHHSFYSIEEYYEYNDDKGM